MRLESFMLLTCQSVRPPVSTWQHRHRVLFRPLCLPGYLLLRKICLTLHTTFCHCSVSPPDIFSNHVFFPSLACSYIILKSLGGNTQFTDCTPARPPGSASRVSIIPQISVFLFLGLFSLFWVEYLPKQLFKKGYGEGDL